MFQKTTRRLRERGLSPEQAREKAFARLERRNIGRDGNPALRRKIAERVETRGMPAAQAPAPQRPQPAAQFPGFANQMPSFAPPQQMQGLFGQMSGFGNFPVQRPNFGFGQPQALPATFQQKIQPAPQISVGNPFGFLG